MTLIFNYNKNIIIWSVEKIATDISIIKEQNNVPIAQGKLLNIEIKTMKGCVL